MAAVAPAAARSCLALALRPATLGRLLVPTRTPFVPELVRLVVAAAAEEAVMPEALLEAKVEPAATDLIGLLPITPVASRGRRLVPTFTPADVAGGSGSGRGVEMVLYRLIGDCSRLLAARVFATGTEVFWPVMNSWRMASSGFIRRSGSHLRQRERKSRKGSSSHFSTCCKVLDEGRRLLPFDDTVNRGLPNESKKSFFLVLFSIKCFSGGPNTSMMHASCSCSFSPGKMGTPVYNSARIQPRLHMSIGMP